MNPKRVLSLGQCAADNWSLTQIFETHFAAEVTAVDFEAEAVAKLRAEAFDLVLVNRLLDADGSPGLAIIKRLKASKELPSVPIMLVSNYEEAQREAMRQGAAPGFGKASLGQPAMIQVVRNALKE